MTPRDESRLARLREGVMEACHRAVDHLDGAARDARRAVNGAVDLAPEDLAALTARSRGGRAFEQPLDSASSG